MALTTESALRKDRRTSTEMQHRHFAFIAAVIDSMTVARDLEDRRAIARDFADACAVSNPRFDRARFMRACGVGP